MGENVDVKINKNITIKWKIEDSDNFKYYYLYDNIINKNVPKLLVEYLSKKNDIEIEIISQKIKNNIPSVNLSSNFNILNISLIIPKLITFIPIHIGM